MQLGYKRLEKLVHANETRLFCCDTERSVAGPFQEIRLTDQNKQRL